MCDNYIYKSKSSEKNDDKKLIENTSSSPLDYLFEAMDSVFNEEKK